MKIFYLIGPSGSGKDTLRSAILKSEDIHVEPLVNVTTRPMRKGEVDGREYRFITRKKFDELKDSDNLIEARDYQVNDGDIWSYATLIPHSDDNALYIGAGTTDSYRAIREMFGDGICRPIFIHVDDDIRLNRAILRCGNNRKALLEVCRRFMSDCEEYTSEALDGIGINRTNTIDNCEDITGTLHKLRAYIMKHSRTERK